MKWSDVEITDFKGTVHKGGAAAKFVRTNCPDAPIGPIPKIPTSICLHPGKPNQSVTPKDIRKVLFHCLSGKAKSLRILAGDQTERVNLPLARAVKNVFNVVPTQLKVEFFYKQAPESKSPREYLEDSIITVKALREGIGVPLIMDTVKGVADFGVVTPGKYTITADYPESDECKYDWIDETRDVVLKPSCIEIIEFQVEPLYQKVQFIAHSLLTIPNYAFKFTEKDKEKAEIIDYFGKKTFAYKLNPNKDRLYKIEELKPKLPGEKAIISEIDDDTGEAILTMKLNEPPVEFWTLEELGEAFTNPEKMVLTRIQEAPPVYQVDFKEGYNKDNLQPSVQRAQFNEKTIDIYTLTLQKKNDTDYWQLEDLGSGIKDVIMVKKIEKKAEIPPTYGVEFQEGWTNTGLEPPVPSTRGVFEKKIGKSTTLSLLAKMPKKPPVEYWKLEELDQDILKSEVVIKKQGVINKQAYDIELKNGEDSRKILQPMIVKKQITINAAGKILTLQKKPQYPYWKLDDLKLDLEKIEILGNVENDPNAYKMRFKRCLVPFDKEDLEGDWKAEYHGFVEDELDIQARVDFVADTIGKAFVESDKKPTVLKVFMVPECFFQGLFGAYLTDDAAKLVEKLQELVKEEKWRDWVFSFGTVNRVFLGLQPKGVTDEQNIYEMANHAPVIRGGWEASGLSVDHSTRLIQKLVNSAELADEGSLIVNPEAKKIRPQAVNENVQFEATENDEKVSNLLIRLLDAKIPDSFGLPEALWLDLKEGIKKIIRELGIARVVRQIRISDNREVNDKDMLEWSFCAKDPKKEISETLYRTKLTCLPTLKDAALMIIKREWSQREPVTEFSKSEWVKDDEKRNYIISKLPEESHNQFANACGFHLPYQQNEIRAQIMALRDDEFKAKNFVPDKLDLSFEPSIFPIWRKLLELYAGKDTVPFEYVQSGMSLEDYCFAGPRKAGAWYSDLEKAKKVKACKRMVFGLEICADHPTKRLAVLNKMNTPNPVIGIDFHLLPSAGFAPSYFGTRENGYIFNCDGWNKPHPKGGAKLEVMFEGPKSEARVLKDGTLSGFANPVFPHSAVAKRIGQAKDVAVCLEPEKVSADLNKKLSEVIFAHGPGELHFYPIQDLPK